jgi:Multimeric flavodoxin WrbA
MIDLKVIAVNGSPRKTWNTATLLQKALDGAKSAGAETSLIHLYDLRFKGCTSCFACKRKDPSRPGHCAMKDELTGILEDILQCDVLLLGSPVYFGNISGEMLSFLERLLFSNLTYNTGQRSVFKGKIASGFIYTMNVPDDVMKTVNYDALFQHYQSLLQLLNGPSEFLLANDTYQFDDYSQYEASRFDEKHKLHVKTTQFPIDCQKAFDIGARLATQVVTL